MSGLAEASLLGHSMAHPNLLNTAYPVPSVQPSAFERTQTPANLTETHDLPMALQKEGMGADRNVRRVQPKDQDEEG